jgi:hypothetical protein
MDHLGFVEAVDGFGEGIVVAVTDAADRGLDTRLGKPLGILDRDVLGRFKRSSQHLDKGSCDEHSEAAFGSVRARRVAVARPALGGAP